MSSIQRRKRRANGGGRRDAPDVKLMKTIDSFVRSISAIDLRLTLRCSVCAKSTSPLGNLRPLMKALEISCHGIPWLLGSFILLLSLHKPEHIEILMNLFIGLVCDLIIIAVLKVVAQRERPNINKQDMFATISIDNYSFPSGHTTRAVFLAFFFAEKVQLEAPFIGLIGLWSVFVTMSRIMLGRHHFSDVLCGILIGIIEYKLLSRYWLPQDVCMAILEPFFAHFHL